MEVMFVILYIRRNKLLFVRRRSGTRTDDPEIYRGEPRDKSCCCSQGHLGDPHHNYAPLDVCLCYLDCVVDRSLVDTVFGGCDSMLSIADSPRCIAKETRSSGRIWEKSGRTLRASSTTFPLLMA